MASGDHTTQAWRGVNNSHLGPDAVGLGAGVQAGVSFNVGVDSGKLSGLTPSVSCSGAIGPAGFSGTYLRDWDGDESLGASVTSGASLGCSGMILWSW
jgi:hypothetical protein